MQASYSGKTALITGGASGIGRALALRLAALGARPVILDIDGEGARQVVQELERRGRSGEARSVDVRDRAALGAEIESAAARGGIDYLFNNAGIAVFGEARDYDWAAWQDVIETNLLGVIHGVAAAYPLMARQGHGHIVNVASLAALTPTPWAVSYTAAKCGVWGLSRALRVEAAPLGVQVSCVCPSAVVTPIIDRTRYLNLDREQAYAAVPGRRMSAEACAEAILCGVARNRAVIAPGEAWQIALIYRLFPGLVEWGMLRAGRKLAVVRSRYLAKEG